MKAPYKTSVVRVPDPLVPIVEKMMEIYRQKILEGEQMGYSLDWGTVYATIGELQGDKYIIDRVKDILKVKGTRKAAISKLLRVILNRKFDEKEFED